MIEPIWTDIRPADLATILNGVMGVLAIAAFAAGDATLGFLLVFAAIIVDGIDGFVARLGGGGGPLGTPLDNLADGITFVAAPAVGALLVLDHDVGLVGAATASVVYLAAGLLRLARFQTIPDARHFWGLSTPGGALILGTAAILWSGWGVLAASILAALLMLSRWPLPKLRGAIGVMGVLIIVTVLGVAMAMPAWLHWALMGQAACVAFYILAGPVHLKRKGLLDRLDGQA